MDVRIVAHFVAGFPSFNESLDIARGLIAGGAYALEMQIPFSDPSADGPVIESACHHALEQGFRVADAFHLLNTLRSETSIPLFVMCYAGLATVNDISSFVQTAQQAGARGLIIPDLRPGTDEGLYAVATQTSCPAIPVIVPWIGEERLDFVLSQAKEWVYVALRSGVTGTYTELGEEHTTFLGKLRKRSVAVASAEGRKAPQCMAGFGVQSYEQTRMLCQWADAAVAGSAVVKAVASTEASPGKVAERLIQSLRVSPAEPGRKFSD